MPEQDLDMELDAGLEPVVVVNTTYKRFVSWTFSLYYNINRYNKHRLKTL